MTNETMTDESLSYHNNPTLKDKTIARAKRHIEADMLMVGIYWDWESGGGCSVGCHAVDLGLRPNHHEALADAIGWPEWLVQLQDEIFEGLPDNDSRAAWHLNIVSAVPVGKDLQPAHHRIISRILREVGWRAAQSKPDPWGVTAVVDRMADLHDQQTPPEDPAWEEATKEAEAAQEAARVGAAKTAKESEVAWEAVRAAQSAQTIDAAARVAILAAWSAQPAQAAQSAVGAVRSAAWSAQSAQAAQSAVGAVRSAAWSAQSAQGTAWPQIAAIVLEEVAKNTRCLSN